MTKKRQILERSSTHIDNTRKCECEEGRKRNASQEKRNGSDPRYTKNLHYCGEIAVIKSIKEHKDKTDDQGHKPIFLGYGEKHAGDVFSFSEYKNWKGPTVTR